MFFVAVLELVYVSLLYLSHVLAFELDVGVTLEFQHLQRNGFVLQVVH